jgi:hypothetical protein
MLGLFFKWIKMDPLSSGMWFIAMSTAIYETTINKNTTNGTILFCLAFIIATPKK